MSHAFAVLATLIILLTPQLVPATQHHRRITGDLAEALGAVAVEMQVPIVGELALPLPSGINLPEGSGTAEHLLDSIVATSPGYSWKWEGRVAHVYNRRLLTASANFLNLQLESFVLPQNVAELYVTLHNALWQCGIPKRIANDRRCRVPLGFVLGGLWPSALEPLRLTPRNKGVMSARRVMLEAAAENGQFYSIVVFPHATARTPEDAEFAFYHWAWHPLSDAAKPFPSPFSYYDRRFRVAPDILLRNLLTPLVVSKSPNAKLYITVDEHGKVAQLSIVEGQIGKRALQSIRSWRFKPYLLNGLPAKLVCELPVEVAADGSVHPALSKVRP